jgi:hypothetical protein
LALYWLLAVTLQFLFFFGIAAVSALLTGNRFAMLAVYAIFNFVAMLLYGVLVVVYVPMLYGVVAQLDDFSLFSPVVRLFSYNYFEFEKYSTITDNIYGHTQTHYRFAGLADSWGYLAVLGVIGLGSMAAALLLYRKRHLESAGDFVAFRKMKVPVCLVLTLCVTQLFALMGEVTGNMVIWVAVGAIIGFFGSMMLLERRIKVFRKKTFLGFGALVLALIVSFSAVQFDWFGIADWTPRAEQVKSVTIANYRMSANSYSYEDYYSGNHVRLTLTEQEQIAQIIEAHEDILDRRNESDQPTHAVFIYYTLTDGRTVARYYRAPVSGKNYTIFRSYFYTTKQILGYQDWDAFLEGIQYMRSDLGDIPKELYKKVMEALRVDCTNGHIKLGFSKNPYGFLEYHAVEQNGRVVHRTLYMTEETAQITRILQSPEVVLGYSDWQTYLNSIVSIELNGKALKQAQYEGLLTALRQDCENGRVKSNDTGNTSVDIQFTYGDDEYYHRSIAISTQMKATQQWLEDNNAK